MIQDWGSAHWKYFWLSLLPRKYLQPDPTANGIQYIHHQVMEAGGPGRNGGNFSEKISPHPFGKVVPEDWSSSPSFINSQRRRVTTTAPLRPNYLRTVWRFE